MFHANAWGIAVRRRGWPAPTSSCPDRFLQAEPLARFIEQERPTCAGAVPTIWTDLLRYAEQTTTSTSRRCERVMCGGVGRAARR